MRTEVGRTFMTAALRGVINSDLFECNKINIWVINCCSYGKKTYVILSINQLERGKEALEERTCHIS